jgi:hypothetical protein
MGKTTVLPVSICSRKVQEDAQLALIASMDTAIIILAGKHSFKH